MGAMVDNCSINVMESIDILLENAVKTYQESSLQKSKKLFLLDAIPAKTLNVHKEIYANIPVGERAMVLFGHVGAIRIGSWGCTGVVITDKKLYYRTLKDAFLTSITNKKGEEGSISLEKIKDLRIGEHDHCYGTNYVGHQLIINGIVLGLVRMGSGIMYDEEMMDGINQLGKVFSK